MATVETVLEETGSRTLEALCDTFIPAVAQEGSDEVEQQFMARAASALSVPLEIERLMTQTMTPEEQAQVSELLAGLERAGLLELDLAGRTSLVQEIAAGDPAARQGLQALKGLAMLFFYALPDGAGRNPNWEAIGFPGPKSQPPDAEAAPKTIRTKAVSGQSARLSCDVCVVGSGAGGSVIAARCAAAGKSVLVLEMGAYRNEADFSNLELPGYFDLYYRGGLVTSESGSITLFAGSTLGGGTVVNYMNCVRTPETILDEWERAGLTGLASADFIEQHMDVVMSRIGANTEATRQNRVHQKMIAGCDALGYEHRPIWRNASVDDDAELCGFCALGCQRGCKRSAMKTWLQDASDSGAEAIVGACAERILTRDGRASGVEATITHPDGTSTALIIEAPTVIVACGAIESPALLLRSGIGGPAVGKNLRLHPAFLVTGIYDEPIEAWEGQIQSALSDRFADIDDGCGFLIEAVGGLPGLLAPGLPWVSGREHKRLMTLLPWMASFVSVARDHGAGEVALDPLGRALVRWELGDEVDRKLAITAHRELAKLHEAAGASQVLTLHTSEHRWQRGEEPFEGFLEALQAAGYAAGEVPCFTAHQMGSCRMGSNPATSVADGRGELHTTPGVWIGDASAFPSAPGVNPMVSVMSLAHRTAGEILA